MLLNVFDFDDTLFRIPTHNVDKNFDLKGDVHTWYDNPVSLDFKKHRTQLITSVSDCMHHDDTFDYTENIVITRRIPEMYGPVMEVLNHYGLKFDRVFTVGHEGHKYEFLHNYIVEHHTHGSDCDVDEVRIFEDSLYQIVEYQQQLTVPLSTNVRYFFVDKTHLLEIDSLDALTIGKLKLIERP